MLLVVIDINACIVVGMYIDDVVVLMLLMQTMLLCIVVLCVHKLCIT